MFEVGKKYKSEVFPDKIYTCKGIGDVFAFLESNKDSYWCISKDDKNSGLVEVREPRAIYVNEYDGKLHSNSHKSIKEAQEASCSPTVKVRKFIEVLD